MKRVLSTALCAGVCVVASVVMSPAQASVFDRVQCTGYGNAGYGDGPLLGLHQSKVENKCIHPFSDGMAAVLLPPPQQAAQQTTQQADISHTGGKPLETSRSPYNWGFLDTHGKLVIKPLFDQAHDFSDGFAAVARNGQWGYIDKQGKWVIPAQFDVADDFSQIGLASVRREDGRFALIDTHGKVVRMLDASVRDAYLTAGSPGLLQLRYNDEWLSSHGKTVVMPAGLRVRMPLDTAGLFVAANKSGKYGVVNVSGKWLIKPQFRYVSAPLVEGGLLRARGERGQPDALIDQSGKVVTGKKVQKAESLGKYFWVLTLGDETRHLANTKGKVIGELNGLSRLGVRKVGRFAVWKSNDQWYVAMAGGSKAQAAPKGAEPELRDHGGALWWTDRRGHLVAVLMQNGQWVKAQPWFASVTNGFTQNGYQFFKNRSNALVNALTPDGKTLLKPDVATELQRHSINFMDTLPSTGTQPVALATISDCACNERTGAGLLLSDGTIVRNPKWYGVKSLDSSAHYVATPKQAAGQRFIVQTDTGDGMIDAAGHMLIAPTQRFIGPYSYGISLVYGGGKSYVANRQGKLVDAPDYFLIQAAGPDLLRFHQTAAAGKPWGLYDVKTGKELVPAVLKNVGLFKHGYAMARNAQGKAGVLNSQGKWVVPPRFGSLKPLTPTLWLASDASPSNLPNDDDNDDDKAVPRSVVSLNGKTVVPPTKGLHARVLDNGFVLAYQQGNGGQTARSQWLISDKGKQIAGGPGLRIEKTKTGWWDIKRADAQEYVNSKGQQVPPPSTAKVAHNKANDKANDKAKSAPRYDELGLFVDGLAFAGTEGVYGYVNRDNRFVIAPAFQAASEFDHGAAVASTRDSSMVIDQSGRPLARVVMHCGQRVLFDAHNKIVWPLATSKNCR